MLSGSVVAGHYNNLEEKGLAARNESRILHMRNFNNWIKSFLINKHMEEVRNGMSSGDQRVSVIDLGCGKGGDLLKWSKVRRRGQGAFNYTECRLLLHAISWSSLEVVPRMSINSIRSNRYLFMNVIVYSCIHKWIIC